MRVHFLTALKNVQLNKSFSLIFSPKNVLFLAQMKNHVVLAVSCERSLEYEGFILFCFGAICFFVFIFLSRNKAKEFRSCFGVIAVTHGSEKENQLVCIGNK